MPKTYGVFVGQQPGIYGSWDEAKANVSGFSNAHHQLYKSREEAEAAWLAFMKKQRHSPGKEFEAHCTSPYEPSVRCTGKGKSPVSSSSSRSSSHGVTIEQAIEERDEAVHKFEELKSKMKLLLLD